MIGDDAKDDKDRSFTDQDVGDPVVPCQTPLKDKRHIWIVQWMRDDYPGIKACDGASPTHELKFWTWNTKTAKKQEVLDRAGGAKQGDIFLADAHGAFDAGSNVVGIDTKWGDKPTVVKTADLAAAFKEAAIVLLFGCRTGEILKALVDGSKIKLAFGIMSDSGLALAGDATWLENTRAAEATATQLAMDKKLKWALYYGQEQLKTSKSAYDANVVLYPTDKYDLNKSLKDNGLL